MLAGCARTFGISQNTSVAQVGNIFSTCRDSGAWLGKLCVWPPLSLVCVCAFFSCVVICLLGTPAKLAMFLSRQWFLSSCLSPNKKDHWRAKLRADWCFSTYSPHRGTGPHPDSKSICPSEERVWTFAWRRERVNYFSRCHDRMPDKVNLRMGVLLLAHSLKAWWRGGGVWARQPHRLHKELAVGAPSASS